MFSETLTLVDADRPGLAETTARQFEVDLYLPQNQSAAPVVIISHGWGSAKESFAWLAQHLASHGFAGGCCPSILVVISNFQRLFLSGMFDEDIPPSGIRRSPP